MSTITVVFSRRHHVGSVLLRAALWSPWSHCALVDGDRVLEAAAPHGVRARTLAELCAEASRFEVRELPCPDPAAAIAWAESQLGKPYDYRGVVGIGFRRRWQDADAWFCSEFVSEAIRQGGRALFRADAYRITPLHLHIPNFG